MLTLIFCSITGSTQAQKPYTIKITFAGAEFDHKKLDIEFANSFQISSVPAGVPDQIVETNSTYLRFPVLQIIYFSSSHSPTFYRFFLSEPTTELEIYYDSLADDIKVNAKSPVLSFADAGQRKYELFAKHEMLKLEEFNARYKGDLSAADSTVMNQLDTIIVAIREKNMEFAMKYPTFLYSRWLFMYEIIGDKKYSNEYLLSVYNTYFKPALKDTFEEEFILTRLDSNRLGIHSKAPFQDIVFKDLTGNSYNVASFRGKPLIIMVWSTSCVPCIEELPTLKNLHAKFKKELEIVSFSTDTNETRLRNFIAEKHMDWINVYDRGDLSRIYGSDQGIPQVYLLDRNSVIVYSRNKLEDNNLGKLESYIENVLKEK